MVSANVHTASALHSPREVCSRIRSETCMKQMPSNCGGYQLWQEADIKQVDIKYQSASYTVDDRVHSVQLPNRPSLLRPNELPT